MLLQGVIEDASLALLFHAEEFPADLAEGGSFTLDAYKSDSESTPAERAAGDGIFTLDGDALTSLDATLADGIVHATATSDVVIPLQIHVAPGQGTTGPEDGHIVSTLDIAEFSARLEVEENEGQLQSTDSVTDADGNPVNYLAGAVRAESTVSLVNQFITGFCDVDAFLAFSDATDDADGTTPSVTADAAVVTALQAHADTLCQGLGDYAVKADKIAELFDVDTDDNGVYDAMSIGFDASVTGAALAE